MNNFFFKKKTEVVIFFLSLDIQGSYKKRVMVFNTQKNVYNTQTLLLE
jgi:hypothetical protein